MTNRIYTVGHSNRSIEEFVEILQVARIQIVADVRRLPGSRAYPQFNDDALALSLGEFQIAYQHLSLLGGRRGKTMGARSEINAGWRNRSFHNYADYALSAEFRSGLGQLIELGRARRCAMMCSEAVWWRCHRRIVADHLLARGEEVVHLLEKGRMQPAQLSAGAVVRDDGSVIYPPDG